MDWIWHRVVYAQWYEALAFGVGTCAVIALVIWIPEGVYRAALSSSVEPRVFYLRALLAPVARDLTDQDGLRPETRQRIAELASTTGAGHRFRCICIWSLAGAVVHGTDTVQACVPSPTRFQKALAGAVSFVLDRPKAESLADLPSGANLVEIYVPVLSRVGDRVVGVAMVHEVIDQFHAELQAARANAWSLVGAAVASTAVTLLAIGWWRSRKSPGARIAPPQSDPSSTGESKQAPMSSGPSRQRNEGASLRQIASDLHDGAVQLVALALLRLDDLESQTITGRERQLELIRTTLRDALVEIRAVISGPSLATVLENSPEETIRLAAAAHERRTGTTVDCHVSDLPAGLPASLQMCLYRFIQEALNNAYKHANGEGQSVRAMRDAGGIAVEVSDTGPGMDEERAMAESRGLAGMRHRVESLGGEFELTSGPSRGTRIVARFRTR